MYFPGVDAAGIDAMFPVTEEEFTKFSDALKLKISSFSVSIQSYFILNLSLIWIDNFGKRKISTIIMSPQETALKIFCLPELMACFPFHINFWSCS